MGQTIFSFFRCVSGLESFCWLSLCHGFWVCGQKFIAFRLLSCISVPKKGSLIQRGQKGKREAKLMPGVEKAWKDRLNQCPNVDSASALWGQEWWRLPMGQQGEPQQPGPVPWSLGPQPERSCPPCPSWRHFPKIVFVTQTCQFVLFSKRNPDNLFFFLRETETIGNAHKGPVQSLKGLTVRLRLVSKCQSPKKF